MRASTTSPTLRYWPRLLCIFRKTFHLVASGSRAARRCRSGDGTVRAPGGRARGDQVAGEQVLKAGKFGQGLGRAEDEVGGRIVLPHRPVHRKPELEGLHLGEVARFQQAEVRPHGAEGPVALALVELHLGDLDIARRIIVDDDKAGDELMQVGVGHGDFGRDVALDDEAKLDLVVEKTNVPRLDQRDRPARCNWTPW